MSKSSDTVFVYFFDIIIWIDSDRESLLNREFIPVSAATKRIGALVAVMEISTSTVSG